MLYLTEQDVLTCLSMEKAIELVERVFREFAEGKAVNHPRRRVILPSGSVLHYMAGGTPEYFGIKIYSSNPKTGAHFQFLLYRSDDGAPLATIEANHLGQIRTGAASAVATRYMARKDASVLGIIGSGFQAETQLEAMLAVRAIKEVRVWSRKQDRREQFARRCAERFRINIRAVSTAQAAVEGADIIVTATNSKDPVLENGRVKPGAHINAMGSNWANRRELPSGLVGRADVVAVDSVEQGRMESGDLVLAAEDGVWNFDRAVELSSVITGRVIAPTHEHQLTIFKSNGLAIEDVVAAGYVFEQAVQRGLGTRTTPEQASAARRPATR